MDMVIDTTNKRLSTKTSGPTFKTSSLIWFNIVVGLLFANSLMISALSIVNVVKPIIYGNIYYYFTLTFLEEVNQPIVDLIVGLSIGYFISYQETLFERER